jgi:outer membrane protein TolC
MIGKVSAIVDPLMAALTLLCLANSSSPQAPSPTATPPVAPVISPAQVTVGSLTLDEALRLANAQASTYQTAVLNEKITAEDVKQAQAALLPKVSAPLSYIYTSPALGLPPGEPRAPSFIANNAIGEYEALMNVSGDLDVAGKLRATLRKNRALLAAAHA